jgi:hypothetical protein
MRWAVRYRPDTDLGRRFTATSTAHFATRQAAEDMRMQCANAESMETVPVEEDE